MKTKNLLIAVLVIALAAYFGANFSSKIAPTPTAPQTAYEHILQTGTVRCAYIVYTPYFIRDPNTGKMSGIFYDIMEEIGKNAGLKIEWTEEVGYDNIFAGLDAKRFDVFAGGLWPSSARAKSGSFTTPAFYSIITAWARADENRFQNLEGINDPATRITAIDGALEDIIARTDFPQAQKVSLPQMTPFGLNFQNIVDHKADITFAEPSVVNEFLKTHEGTLKQISPDKPLRIFGNSLVIGHGEDALKALMNEAMQEAVLSGAVDKILKKYEEKPGLFLRPIKPYQEAVGNVVP